MNRFEEARAEIEARISSGRKGGRPGNGSERRAGAPTQEEPEKRSRGSRAAAAGAPEGPEVTEAHLTPLIRSTFNLFLERLQLEPLNQSEAAELAKVYKPVAEKYIPWLIANYGLEIAAAGTTIAILGPRWQEWLDLRRQTKEREKGIPIEDLEESEPEPVEAPDPEIPSHALG